jgi:hypothetical protein
MPALASADLVLDGSEFQVNTYTTHAQLGRAALQALSRSR